MQAGSDCSLISVQIVSAECIHPLILYDVGRVPVPRDYRSARILVGWRKRRLNQSFSFYRRTGQGGREGSRPPWILETSKIRADGMGNSGIQGTEFF